MKTLAEAMQMHGGIFLIVQIIIILLILIQSTRILISYYGKQEIGSPAFIHSHHSILFLGIVGFVWGFFMQLIGFIQALNAIIEAADVSPALIMMGLRNSFINPAIGLGTLLCSALVWALLHSRFSNS